ncbi:hypothetical protein GCG54_00003840 [Colletotrichum gloeosporioides]|uniref:Uncharacterized protein n=1 Tax=Colletotrichum gloeosporioides TaxID=474922 RepID=A0A8H4CEM6_COLGL|nr:uncharacterized protein GCG54_00003840 [Colletotrichum gloeosporioides]KAF3802374.1 hypothetical protein GCG54_00003840 [Colletotrichum gloeosporioides]
MIDCAKSNPTIDLNYAFQCGTYLESSGNTRTRLLVSSQRSPVRRFKELIILLSNTNNGWSIKIRVPGVYYINLSSDFDLSNCMFCGT